MPDSDDLLAAAYEYRNEIRAAYSLWKETKPIVLFHLQEQRVYVYPYEPYKNTLSARSQVSLKAQYDQAALENKIVLFVRDEERQRLVSFSIGQEPDEREVPDASAISIRQITDKDG